MKFILFAFLIIQPCIAMASSPKIVTTIKPIHSLTAAILKGVDTPFLLIDNTSPHDVILKPFQVKLLSEADLLIYISPKFESILARGITILPKEAAIIELSSLNDLHLIHKKPKAEDTSIHQHTSLDYHLWLDPHNSHVWITTITKTLIELYPNHKELLEQNAHNLRQEITQVTNSIIESFEGKTPLSLVSYHNSIQYFTAFFALGEYNYLTEHAESPLLQSAMTEFRKRAQSKEYSCFLVETDTPKQFLRHLLKLETIPIQPIDPLGQSYDAGPTLYISLLNNLAQQIIHCTH